MSRPRHRQRTVIVGAGVAGFHAARSLARLAKDPTGVEVVLVNPTEHRGGRSPPTTALAGCHIHGGASPSLSKAEHKR
jgi:monoamine oxidase